MDCGVKILGCLAVVLCAAVEVGPALAQTQPADSELVLMLVADDRQDRSLPVVRAVTSQMSDVEVEFLLESVASHPQGLKAQVDAAKSLGRAREAVAVFWFDFVAGDTIFLYLIQSEADRILVRDIKEAEEGGRAEALAVIVRLSVAEILRGGTIGIKVAEAVPATTEPATPAPVAPPAAAPVAPPEAPPVPGYHLLCAAVAYAFYVHSGEHPANHGAHAEVCVRPHENLAVLGGYTVFASLWTRTDIAHLRLDRHPARLGVRLDFALGRVRLGGSVSLIIDYTTFEVTNLASGIAPVDDRSDVVISLLPLLELGVRITDWLVPFVALGAEIALNPLIYETGGPYGERALIEPWPAQPWAQAGLVFEFF